MREAGSLGVAGVWFFPTLGLCVSVCVTSWGARMHTFQPCAPGRAGLVQPTSHPGRCPLPLLSEAAAQRGPFPNTRAQTSRLLGAELMGAGHLQREEGGPAVRRGVFLRG